MVLGNWDDMLIPFAQAALSREYVIGSAQSRADCGLGPSRAYSGPARD
jgi:hypothetical protein